MAENKYTVNARILDLQSRVHSLEKENKQLRLWVNGELTNKINDARNILRGQIRDGVDGRDGRDGVDGQSIVGPQGPKGESGDVQYLNLADKKEVLAYVKANRRLVLEHHARVIESIDRHINDNSKNSSSLHRLMRLQLEDIKREIGGLDIAV